METPFKTYSSKFYTFSHKLKTNSLHSLEDIEDELAEFNYDVPNDQLHWYTKQIFADVGTMKLYFEAKKALERCGINPSDLKEKCLEEFNYHARNEFVTPDMVKMRYLHFENRRRRKIRTLAEYIKANR